MVHEQERSEMYAALGLEADRTYVIGEVAQGHDGSLGTAHAFIDAIADAGCDAVKFQTHIAAAESTLDEPWRVRFSPQDERRYDYWVRMEFAEKQWVGLAEHARARSLDFLSSPFSVEAVELLERVGVRWWKIASGELFNPEVLTAVWTTGRPVVYSTGLSTIEELDHVIDRQRAAGTPFAIMQCTSAYPAPPDRWGLQMLAALRERYGVPVGLSDHSGTVFAGLAAAALEADLLEVHVTLCRHVFGPDVPASITPSELRTLVDGVRQIRASLAADYSKDESTAEAHELRRMFSRSWALREHLTAGTVLERRHLTLKKPGTGLPFDALDQLVGRTLRIDKPANRLLTRDDVG
jgi:N,N'-diacetyllegionaminate synthase